jgi:hypothetical protein
VFPAVIKAASAIIGRSQAPTVSKGHTQKLTTDHRPQHMASPCPAQLWGPDPSCTCLLPPTPATPRPPPTVAACCRAAAGGRPCPPLPPASSRHPPAACCPPPAACASPCAHGAWLLPQCQGPGQGLWGQHKGKGAGSAAINGVDQQPHTCGCLSPSPLLLAQPGHLVCLYLPMTPKSRSHVAAACPQKRVGFISSGCRERSALTWALGVLVPAVVLCKGTVLQHHLKAGHTRLHCFLAFAFYSPGHLVRLCLQDPAASHSRAGHL